MSIGITLIISILMFQKLNGEKRIGFTLCEKNSLLKKTEQYLIFKVLLFFNNARKLIYYSQLKNYLLLVR